MRDAGKGGWGAAATASSTAFAGVWFVLLTIGAARAYTIAKPGNEALASGLNDLVCVFLVLSGFPTGMLIWVIGISGVLLRRPSTEHVTGQAAVPAQ